MSEFAPIGDPPHTTATSTPAYRHHGMWRGYPLAGLLQRTIAAAINYGGSAIVARMITSPIGGSTGDNLDLLIWIGLAVVMVGVNPRGLDVGKSALGLTTVRPIWTPSGQPGFADLSAGTRGLRVLAHVPDFPFLIGFILVGLRWNRRSIADVIFGTIVLAVPRSQLSLFPPESNGRQLPRDDG